MEHLVRLFSLMQLTRHQVQYGYLLAGVPRERLSDLAQHHYLVTFIAWQMARGCRQAGAEIDVMRIMEIALTHDIGELPGGDVSMPFVMANPRIRKFAKAFEAENQKVLAKFFGDDARYIRELWKHECELDCDEARIAKIADLLECMFFKEQVGSIDRKDGIERTLYRSERILIGMRDATARVWLRAFLKLWAKECYVHPTKLFFRPLMKRSATRRRKSM